MKLHLPSKTTMRVYVSLLSSNEHHCCKARGKLDTQGELEVVFFFKDCIPHTAQTIPQRHCVILQPLISHWLLLAGQKRTTMFVSFLPLCTGSVNNLTVDFKFGFNDFYSSSWPGFKRSNWPLTSGVPNVRWPLRVFGSWWRTQSDDETHEIGSTGFLVSF